MAKILGWLVLGAAALATGCGTDGTNSSSGSCKNENIDHNAVLQILDSANKPAAAQYEVDITTIAAGTAREFVFTISNTASAVAGRALTIKAIALTETDANDAAVAEKAFSCTGPDGKDCAAAAFPAIIPAGFDSACAPAGAKTTATLTIRYKRISNPDLRRLKLSVTFAGDVKIGDTPWTATFATRLGSPKFECAPPVTDFGKVSLSESATNTVTCSNTGKGEGRITAAVMLGSLPLHAKLGSFDIAAATPLPAGQVVTVAAGTAIEIPVAFDKLQSEQKSQAILRLTTNETGKEQVDLTFNVNTTGPCLAIDPAATLDFGVQPVGTPINKEVVLKSCGTEDLQLQNIAVAEGADQGFGVSFLSTCFTGVAPSPDKPVVVPKGTVCSLGVSFTAPKLGAQSKGKLAIASNAGQTLLGLSGSAAATVQCPKACIAVKLANGGSLASDVLPQSVLKFDAGCSAPGSGGAAVTKYKWSVVQPAGSFATFQPSASVKNPTLQPNVAGKYTVTLDIADAVDTPGCAQATYDINVVSDDKLYVELTWDTPADPDKTDEQTGTKPVGSDMDLHFAHPDAYDELGQPDLDKNGEPDPWYAPCYDCSVWNVNAKWGSASNFDDDAALDRDDKDGWGPEIIAVHVPQPAIAYTAGAYYFSHNGFGKSTPTIKVYLDGKLAATKVGPSMDMNDMWCAGTVTWTPNKFSPCKGADAKGDLLTKKYPLQPNKNLKCK